MKIILNEEQTRFLMESLSDVNRKANEAERNPTEAQKEAGNYKMGHLRYNGFDISIENPKGSYRHFKNADGSDGKVKMKNHYGYFTRTRAIDGDQTDVFLGPNEKAPNVYVVDQANDKGEFDENKVMLGFSSKEEAKKAYMDNFDDKWKGFRKITGVPVDVFRKWLYSGRKQSKPFSEYVLVKNNISESLNLGSILEEVMEGFNDNKQMNGTKKLKNDEFYTRRDDIELELGNYEDKLSGKRIYCNCDDHTKSNFYGYFKDNFERLGLRSLTATGVNSEGRGVYGIYDGTGEKAGYLEGDGSFDSEESLEFLSKCDIVVSNPPFSLFRKYLNILMKSGKSFLVLGNMNAIHYKEVFPLIKSGEITTGYTGFNKGMYFNVPDDFEYSSNYKGRKEIDGKKVGRVSGICWFTNLGTENRESSPKGLRRRYNADDFKRYDNYDAIEVGSLDDIPYDYDGYIGVPFTIMDKLGPDRTYRCTSPDGEELRYEVVGMMNNGEKNPGIRDAGSRSGNGMVDGKVKFSRVIIRKIK